MKTLSLHSLVVLLVAVSLTLTACQYPYGYGYNSSGPYARTFTPYGSTGYGPLGSLTSCVLGSNRDRYYYVIRGTNAGTRYSARSYYASAPIRPAIYPVSYQVHPYYSTPLHSSPYYSRSPSYSYSYTNRPWGGGYGFGQPFNWGTGLGLGSRWF